MAIKQTAVELVLRAKNLLSPGTDAATRSVEELSQSAEGLDAKLRALEDQKKLIDQFQGAEKAVDKTRAAWDKATLRLDKLKKKLKESGDATDEQAKELQAAERAADVAAKGYARAEDELAEFGREAEKAGIDLENLGSAQRENARETDKAKRAQKELNAVVDESDGKFRKFGSTLRSGVNTFVKWGAAATAAGAALTVTALTRFTASQADLARQTLAQAEAFGISVDALQKWQYAASEVGIGSEKVADIMKDLGDKIGDAFLNDGGEAREALQGLSLDLENLARLNPDEQILAIAKELEGMPKAGQIQILESLANDASLLLPLLENNAARLRELSNAAEERGAIFTEDELEQLKRVDRAFLDITTRVEGFGKEIAIKLAPAFEKMAEKLDKALGDKPELVDKISTAFVTLIEKTGEFTTAIVENKETIGNALNSTVNTVKGLGLSFTAVFRGVQAFGAGTAEVLARVGFDISRVIAVSTRGLNAIGLASDEAVRTAEYRVQNFAASVMDLEEQSEGFKNQMIAAGEAAAAAFVAAGTEARKAGSAIVDAASDVDILDSAASNAAESTATLGEKLSALKIEQTNVKRAIEDTATALEAAGVAYAENGTDENREAVAKLRAEYERLIKTLSTLSETQNELDNPTNTSEGGNGNTGGQGLVQTYRDAADAISGAGDEAEKTFQKVVYVGDQLDKSGNQIEDVGEKAEDTAESVSTGFGAIFGGMIDYVNQLSANAGALFTEILGGKQTDVGSALEQRLERVNALLTYTENRVTNGGVSNTLNEWATAAYRVEQNFLEQSVAVEKVTEKILEGDRASRYLRMSADEIRNSFNLLDDTQLRGLIGAVQSAQREIESLNDSILDTIAATRQELASLAGDSVELENLRYTEKQIELEEQLAKAKALSDKETIRNAETALRLSEQAHKARLRQAEEQSADDEKRALEYEQRQARQRQIDEQQDRQVIARTEDRTQAQTNQIDRAASAPRTIRLEFASGGATLGSVDAINSDQIDRIIDGLQAAGFITTG